MTIGLIRQLLLSTVAVFVTAAANGEIVTMKTVHGRQVACIQSGLRGAYSSCGAADFYSNVLIGKIVSVTNLLNDESRLVIAPEEVFRGEHPSQLVVLTNQGACIGDFHVGERWLLYLFHPSDGKEPLPILEYATGSALVEQAQDEISLLRRQAKKPTMGIVRGTLSKTSEPHAVQNHVVTVRSAKGETRTVKTDEKGHFEFDLLPPSTYAIGDFEKGFKRVRIPVEPKGCYSTSLTLSPSGRVIFDW